MANQKKFKGLNAAFGIEPEPESEVTNITTTTPVEVVSNPETSRLDGDINYVFGVLNATIAKSQEALDGALELAQESEQARAYEVVAQLVKQTVDSAEKIIDIHVKLKEMEAEKSSSTTNNVTNNNAVFIGTTAEAIKMLRAQLKDK